MKVLAVNSSPKNEKGNTSLILDPFIKGMEEEGAKVTLMNTSKLNINPCQGDFHCWVKKPGVCIFKDDMTDILPQIENADILVLASPLYVDGVSGPLKNFLDRMVPLLDPFVTIREGRCRHLRNKSRKSLLVLISNCGLWELENFDPMVAHMKAVSKNLDFEFAGSLLRPHGPSLGPMKELGNRVDDVFEAAMDAGRQVVTNGKFDDETLKTVSRELLSREMYLEIINHRFKQEIEYFRSEEG